jgi:TPR repeat protein
MAVTLLRRAAEAGNAEAMYYLGRAYALGDGVARQSAQARHWLLMAGEHGDAPLWAAVGKLFFTGDLDDPEEARHWLRLAADHGDPEAPLLMACGTNDLDEARLWLLMSAARCPKRERALSGRGESRGG